MYHQNEEFQHKINYIVLEEIISHSICKKVNNWLDFF
jgi:hypothetical protein